MIELKQISKTFGEKEIFKDFNYKFEAGKTYALIGESGSGKTTLLNIIGKLESLEGGSVEVEEKNLKEIKEKYYFRDFVGYLFQNFGLIDNESVESNLELAFVGKKADKNSKSSQINEALKRVNLDIEIKRKIFTFSGGEAQRVALAKLIIKDPPIILADEPTAALDPNNGKEVMKLLLSLKNKKRVIIIATHNPTIWEMADEIVNLSEI